jgi:hypothetical protein
MQGHRLAGCTATCVRYREPTCLIQQSLLRICLACLLQSDGQTASLQQELPQSDAKKHLHFPDIRPAYQRPRAPGVAVLRQISPSELSAPMERDKPEQDMPSLTGSRCHTERSQCADLDRSAGVSLLRDMGVKAGSSMLVDDYAGSLHTDCSCASGRCDWFTSFHCPLTVSAVCRQLRSWPDGPGCCQEGRLH